MACSRVNFAIHFTKVGIFSTDFSKITQYKISGKFFCWELNCSLRTEGQVGMKTLISFGGFYERV